MSAQAARSQTKESAPQEPPYVQEENEFGNTPNNSHAAPGDDIKSIEDEIKSAEAPAKNNGPVNLNEKVPESGAKSSAETALPPPPPEQTPEQQLESSEPSVVPVAPAVEVKPAPQVKAGQVVRQSPRGGVEYIQHPMAAKGLQQINADGTYIYKTSLSDTFNTTGSLRIGSMDSPKITSKDGTTNFETMYQGPPVPIVMFDYEWQPFTSFGRLGIQGGFGLLVTQGSGRFACTDCKAPDGSDLNGLKAKEQYTFVAVPLNIGGIYRLQWKSHQLFVPYAAGGGTYIPVVEFRDDSSTPHAVGTPGVYGAGGLLVNISHLDRETAFTLKNEYDITNLWATAEFRYLKTFNEEIDFTSSIISLGIAIDY